MIYACNQGRDKSWVKLSPQSMARSHTTWMRFSAERPWSRRLISLSLGFTVTKCEWQSRPAGSQWEWSRRRSVARQGP